MPFENQKHEKPLEDDHPIPDRLRGQPLLLKAGDVLVQCGTNHAWSNRSNAPCMVAFVLIDGEFDPALARQFE